MHTFINSPWQLGSLTLPNRLIQGPLAGYSCAPFRTLFYQFTPPAYCVSEMCSAIDVLHKHSPDSRYLYRAAQEQRLAYQISGTDAHIMADAALYLQQLGADLIDINCGCPKAKIRKKGAGSALLDTPDKLIAIISQIRQNIAIPLTVKIRIQGTNKDIDLAQRIAQAGADALIVHGRRWTDDYDIDCDFAQIAAIKRHLSIPVIANGDIDSLCQLQRAFDISHCDGFMIGRASTGKPWLFEELLKQRKNDISIQDRKALFMRHLNDLAQLEQSLQAVLQSKSLIRYYFRQELQEAQLAQFYKLGSLTEIEAFLDMNLNSV